MNVWLINSNSKSANNNPNGFIYMLRQNKVSSFYNRKGSVDKINKNDLILLYHNKNRIIAVGFAIGNNYHDLLDLSKVEHWVDVNWIWKSEFNNDIIPKPLNPIKRDKLKIKSFRRTIENITNQIDYKQLIIEIGKKQNIIL